MYEKYDAPRQTVQSKLMKWILFQISMQIEVQYISLHLFIFNIIILVYSIEPSVVKI